MIAGLLIVSVAYGVYTFRTLGDQINTPALTGNNVPNSDTSTSTTTSPVNPIYVYGNATYFLGGGECGGAFTPTGVEFISSEGVNYTAK